jgi:ribosome assembly protein RRB1
VRVKGRKSAMAVEGAHENDVNVISWNKLASASYLLVSGGDEGGIKVWDLRGWNKSVTLALYPISNSYFLSK